MKGALCCLTHVLTASQSITVWLGGTYVCMHCDLSCAQISTLHLHSHGMVETQSCVYKAGILEYTFLYSELFLECGGLFNLLPSPIYICCPDIVPCFNGARSVHSVAALCMLAWKFGKQLVLRWSPSQM